MMTTYEWHVLQTLGELEDIATFGNMAAYLRIEPDVALMMRGGLPEWLKRLLLARPTATLHLNIALANLEDSGHVRRLRDADMTRWQGYQLPWRERRVRTMFCLTMLGASALMRQGGNGR